MDRSNSILQYLKRKQLEKGEENNASGSGIGSNINECQRDGGNEGESNVHSKSRLLKLALILPVSTTTVERAFSTMKIVKSKLRNRMCDRFLNDCLVCYIDKDVFDSISNDAIMY